VFDASFLLPTVCPSEKKRKRASELDSSSQKKTNKPIVGAFVMGSTELLAAVGEAPK